MGTVKRIREVRLYVQEGWQAHSADSQGPAAILKQIRKEEGLTSE